MTIEETAAELSIREGVKVFPMSFELGPGLPDVIGYLKEPARMTKIRVMDKAISTPISAAYDLFEACLLKGDSDPILQSEKPEHDKFILGATMAAYNLISMAENTYKKK